MSELGTIALYNLIKDSTDLFKIFHTSDHGWQSKYLFSVDREVKKMCADKDRIILDHEVYNPRG
jgi:hypothetical protein